MSVQCGCCGSEMTSTDRIDHGLHRPEALIGVPETDIDQPSRGLMSGPDGEAYLRCLLPVRLTGGTELVFGAWTQVRRDTAMSSPSVREDGTEYTRFTVSGTFANVIRPWDDLLGVPVEAAVRDTNEFPYFTSHPLLEREWDRDEVLSCIQYPLPVPVRETFDDVWTVERSEGMQYTVEDRTTWFSGPGRWVAVDAYADRGGRSVDDFLSLMIDGYPVAEHVVERSGDELRHAFWLTEEHDGEEQHTFHGHVVRPGRMLSVRCVHTDPADRGP